MAEKVSDWLEGRVWGVLGRWAPRSWLEAGGTRALIGCWNESACGANVDFLIVVVDGDANG